MNIDIKTPGGKEKEIVENVVYVFETRHSMQMKI